MSPSHTGSQKRLSTLSGLNSVETMQKSVLNAFSLKYSQLLCKITIEIYMYIVRVHAVYIPVYSEFLSTYMYIQYMDIHVHVHVYIIATCLCEQQATCTSS